jgi:hypothetical protein
MSVQDFANYLLQINSKYRCLYEEAEPLALVNPDLLVQDEDGSAETMIVFASTTICASKSASSSRSSKGSGSAKKEKGRKNSFSYKREKMAPPRKLDVEKLLKLEVEPWVYKGLFISMAAGAEAGASRSVLGERQVSKKLDCIMNSEAWSLWKRENNHASTLSREISSGGGDGGCGGAYSTTTEIAPTTNSIADAATALRSDSVGSLYDELLFTPPPGTRKHRRSSLSLNSEDHSSSALQLTAQLLLLLLPSTAMLMVAVLGSTISRLHASLLPAEDNRVQAKKRK